MDLKLKDSWRIKGLFSGLNLGAMLVLAFVLVGMINYIALRNPLRQDWSGRQYYSLSEKTKSLLDEVDQRVDVIVFFQQEHGLYDDIENLLEEYMYASKFIHVEWVDPARDLARTEKLAAKYDLTEAQVVVFDIGGRSKHVRQTEIAEYKLVEGRKEPVISGFKGEQAFSSAIQGLAQGEKPTVYFLEGHSERQISNFDPRTGFSDIAKIIKRDNIEVKALFLGTEQKIPEDAAALVIAGASQEMSRGEAEMIEDYLNRSGRLMILHDALKKNGLEPMIRRWGVALRNDIVIDPARTLSKGRDVYITEYYAHAITRRMSNVTAVFHMPRSVEPLDAAEKESSAEDRPTVERLTRTSKESWSETQFDQSPTKYDENTADRRGPFSLAVAVERGASQRQLDVQIKPSRMVVFGDSDFVSNGALTGGDQDLFLSALNWLLDREELMAIAAKPIEEVKLSLTSTQLRRMFWLTVGGIPAVAVLIGLVVWVRRRK